MKTLFGKSILVFFIALATSTISSGQQVNFEREDSLDWKSVMAKVKQLNRCIFVYVYSSNSPVDQRFEKKTLKDWEVVDMLNVTFVNLRVNIDSAAGMEIAKKYRIGCSPGFLFLDKSANVIQKGSGYLSPKDFVKLALTHRDPNVNTFAAFEQAFHADQPSPSVALTYLKALSESCMPTNDVAVNYLVSTKDTVCQMPEDWQILKEYVTDIESAPFNYLVNKRKVFISKYNHDEVDAKIFDAYFDRGKELLFKEKADKNKFTAYKTRVVAVVFDRNKELGQTLDWAYADATANWKNYYSISKDLVKKYRSKDAVFLNAASKKLLENMPEPKMMANVLPWAKKAAELNPTNENLDTYAKIVFKTGDKTQAIASENKAIAYAKTQELDTIPYVKTRDLFNQPK